MDCNPVKYSIIIPTIGRPEIEQTLKSIPTRNDIQVIVIMEGCFVNAPFHILRFHPIYTGIHNDYGCYARNLAMKNYAVGKWLLFIDDDDWYMPDAFDVFDEHVDESMPVIFQMRRMAHGDTLWRKPLLRCGNVGTPMFAVPNVKEKLAPWGNRYEGDFDFIKGCVKNFGSVKWCSKVVACIG